MLCITAWMTFLLAVARENNIEGTTVAAATTVGMPPPTRWPTASMCVTEMPPFLLLQGTRLSCPRNMSWHVMSGNEICHELVNVPDTFRDYSTLLKSTRPGIS